MATSPDPPAPHPTSACRQTPIRNSAPPSAAASLALMLALPQLCLPWQPPPSAGAARAARWALGISPHLNGPAPRPASPDADAIRHGWSHGGAELKSERASIEVWVRPLVRGAFAVAAFNNGQRPAHADLVWKELGIPGQPRVRDVLNQQDLGRIHAGFAVKLPAGGAALFRVVPPARAR
ncbi:MAG: hypothetical protein C0504_14980 [Candidatus Solibacter sp.]|nr:hypothetical protein [Candidatus Solibacter sp.]